MNAKENRRSALTDPDFIVLIAPNGTLRRVPIATNIQSRLILKNGKRWVLTEEADEAGWTFLSEHVKPDVLEKIHAHLTAEQANPYKCGKFDEKLLPKICRDRQKEAQQALAARRKTPADANVNADARAALKAEVKAEVLAELKAAGAIPGK